MTAIGESLAASKASAAPRLTSRQIVDDDLSMLAPFLASGVGYPVSYFRTVLDRLRERQVPASFPRYGYVLLEGGAIVGAMLQIYSQVPGATGPMVRCHMATWCVDEAYRSVAALFFRKALNNPNVTFINTSARPVAIPTIKAQGFEKYSAGQFLVSPILAAIGRRHAARVVPAGSPLGASGDPIEEQLMNDHASFGCIALWCVDEDGSHPFIFQRRAFKGYLTGVQLIYCRSVEEFHRFCPEIGLALARMRVFLVRMDALGPAPGCLGWYFDEMEPRYYKGMRPRLGDLAYTQSVLTTYLRKSS